MPAKTPLSKKLRRSIRETAFALLPESLSHRVIRRTLNLALPAPDSPLKFSLATDTAGVRSALALVQQNFEKAGYTPPTRSGIRLTPYHLLPRTVVITVRDGDRVVATTTVIPRTEFGLPIESCYDLRTLFASDPARSVEISALAVDSTYRGSHGELLYNVMKFMYHVNVDVLAAELELIGINPKMAALYQAILLFEPVPGTAVKTYDFANGAPVVPLRFDLRTSHDAFERVYGGKPAPLNLLDFFLAPPPPQFDLPDKAALAPRLPQNRPESLREMLGWEPELLQRLNPSQWDALERAHSGDCREAVREARREAANHG